MPQYGRRAAVQDAINSTAARARWIKKFYFTARGLTCARSKLHRVVSATRRLLRYRLNNINKYLLVPTEFTIGTLHTLGYLCTHSRDVSIWS
jgi:hypothetical protein